MKKGETIERYGEGTYKRELELSKIWWKTHPKEKRQIANEYNRPGGKHYDEYQRKQKIGLRWARNKVRSIHRTRWLEFKKMVAPDSQLHHCWLPRSADYKGVALVEADAHMHGIIDVIQILEGEITLFTEKAIRER